MAGRNKRTLKQINYFEGESESEDEISSEINESELSAISTKKRKKNDNKASN